MAMSVITIPYFSRKPVALGFAGLVCYHKEYAKNFMATDTFPSWVMFERLSSSLNSPWVEFLILGTDSFSSDWLVKLCCKEFIFQTTERHVKLNCAVLRQLTQISRYVMNIVILLNCKNIFHLFFNMKFLKISCYNQDHLMIKITLTELTF